ncbi:hypothetical protein ACF061_05385 [Streptomyces sp. NPDC015220]|uniref:hypothetical protein n=1 Tax=Streptomyces sp. NPDC015220 TaxID=3364947 RepID=UPI0036FD1E3C
MGTTESLKDIMDELSPEARKLVAKVWQLEREHLHVKSPTLLTDEIVRAAKELAK